ncbi:MAG: beta strand repeat-containing protein, partial [Chitinophagaceae bacterium]
ATVNPGTGNTVTINTNVTTSGTVSLQSGTLNIGAGNTLTLNSAITSTGGTLTSAANGTVSYNQGTNGQIVLSASYGNLTFSNFNKVLTNATINIAGTFTPGSASGHTLTGSTFNFNGGAQNIPAFTFNNLTISGTANNTLTGTVIIGNAGTGTLNLDGRNLLLDGKNININGPLSGTGLFTLASGELITIGGSGALGNNLSFSNPNQEILGLYIDRTGQTINFGSNATVYGLNLTNGTLGLNGNSLTLTGAVDVVSGDIAGNSASSITFASGSSGTLKLNNSANTLGNLTVNNNDVISLGSNVTISNSLNIASGVLSIGANTLTIDGTMTGDGSLRGSSTSNVSITGTGAFGTLKMDQTTDESSNMLNNLSINRTSSGSVNLGNNKLIINGTLTLSQGDFNIGSN